MTKESLSQSIYLKRNIDAYTQIFSLRNSFPYHNPQTCTLILTHPSKASFDPT